MKKILIFFIAISFIYACTPQETPTPNRTPDAFRVSQTLKSDGKTIVLNWTKAKDPDGDVVTYSVVLKDTLSKGKTDTTYTITTLDFNASNDGKVIAKDSKGLTTVALFTAKTKFPIYQNISDANFEKYLVIQKIDKDGLVNGRMDVDDAKGVKEIILPSGSIKSLAGIEQFTDLTKLDCDLNSITTLDLSKNINLTYLDCDHNSLTALDLSKNVGLTYLDAYHNALTSIDLSKNLNLTYLDCSDNNGLIVLDVSKNDKLTYLDCSYTAIKVLDVSKNLGLTELDCSNSKFTVLDVSKNVALSYLDCSQNSLTVLDVTKNTKIAGLDCAYALLVGLDVTKNTSLIYLDCSFNKLASLDISKNPTLDEFDCTVNPVKTVCVADIAKATANKKWFKDEFSKYITCK
jgi:Leucine-rich repeat (LRR) protein